MDVTGPATYARRRGGAANSTDALKAKSPKFNPRRSDGSEINTGPT